MNYGEICILLLTVLSAVLADVDYCKESLCGKNKKHIACKNNGNFLNNCVLPEIINMTRSYRRQILKKHNSLRNEIAQGFQYFLPAKRMATMMWDNELANLAELNVKRCDLLHDQCRNTPEFPFVGQNLASTRWKGVNFTVSEVFNIQIETWFSEYTNCSMDTITSYKSSDGPACGRFTTMVQEKSTRLGCAILRSLSCGYIRQIMACNYAYDNIVGAPVYSNGKPASKCATGSNSKFPFLCSVKEQYNLKDMIIET